MHLRKIGISNFRPFGGSFSFEFPPGARVTILVGQNGLGKSAFLEAIEWCLTGTVKRLADLNTEGLRKFDCFGRRSLDGGVATKYSVALDFADQNEVFSTSRSSGGEDRTAEIISRLKSPDWKEPVNDLSAHLRLTHILSQSVDQRFAARDGGDRWEALEAPAGTLRMNSIQQTIGGQKLTRAFSSKIQDLTTRLDNLKNEEQAWQHLCERRDRLSKTSSLYGVLDPQQTIERLLPLEAQLVALAASPSVRPYRGIADSEFQLQHVRAQLQNATEQFARTAGQLEEVDGLPGEIDILQRTSRETEQTLKVAESNSASRLDRLRGLMEIVEPLRGRLAESRSVRAAAQHNINRLTRLSGAIRGYRADRLARLELASVAARRQADLDAALGAEIVATAQLVDRRQLDSEREAIESRLGSLRDAASRWSELTSLAVENPARAARIVKLEAELQELQNAKDAVDARIVDENKVFEDKSRRARALAEKTSAMSRAVAAIAAHITEHDTQCPVCGTPFSVGELKALIGDVTSGAGEELLTAERAALSTKDGLLQLESQQLELKRQFQTILTELTALRVVSDRFVHLEAELAATQIIVPGLGSETGPWLQSEIAIAEHKRDSLLSRQAETPSFDELSSVVASTKSLRETASAQARAVHDDLLQLDARLRQAEAVVQAETTSGLFLDTSDEDERQVLEAAADSLAKAEATVSELNEQERELAATVEKLRNESANDEISIAALKKQLADESERLQARHRQWLSAGLSGEPSTTKIDRAQEELRRRESTMDELERHFSDIVASHVNWRNQADARLTDEEISKKLEMTGAQSEQGYVTYLRDEVNRISSELVATKDALAYREILLERLKNAAGEYSNGVLRPINELNKRYIRMFSCFSDVEVELSASTKNARQTLDLNLRHVGSKSKNKFVPTVRHYLSEGQLSALSLSILLSMSTAFRWSKWRALLLDDPLQHNDIIQGASFVEVLRNLVNDQHYQVIMSTHDVTLADFVRRKLEAGAVAVRTCEFIGIGQDGVMFQAS